MRAFLAVPLISALFACNGEGKATPEKQPAPKPAVAPAVPPLTDAGPVVEVVLNDVVGTVEVKRGGIWVAVGEGSVVVQDEPVRTAAGATASMAIEAVTVRVHERSEVTPQEISQKVADLRLDRGRLSADVPDGSATEVRVGSKGNSAVATTRGGKFAVFNDGNGLVAVAAKAGEVKLVSSGGDAVLAAGEGARVDKAGTLVQEKIPRNVLLNVNWPTAKKNQVTVTGKTDPAATIEINGQTVEVDGEGTFKTAVKLKVGKNVVEVTAHDLFGRDRQVKRTLDLQSRPPPVETKNKNLWR